MDRKTQQVHIYGKKETVRIKGIAIIFMFMLHFFAHPEWILYENMYMTVTDAGFDILMVLSKFGHICVALFAFTTGFALYVWKDKYKNLTYRLLKCIQFLTRYWLVAVLFLLYGWLAKEPMPGVVTFFMQCVGIGTGIFLQGINICTAWYVAFYLLFVLLHPLFMRLSRKNFWMDSVIYFGCLYVGAFFIVKQQIFEIPSVTIRFIERFGLWGTIGMIGSLFAKYQIFEKVDNILRNQKKIPWNIVKGCMGIGLLMMVIVRFILGNMAITDIVYAPMFIYIVSVLCNEWKKEKVDIILGTFAKYSTYMWFVHAIFFTPNNSIQWLAYWPKYPVLILIWTLVMSLFISMVVEASYNKLEGVWTKIKNGVCK